MVNPHRLVPFAVTAALVRGMTLAPRVQVFTQLSCAHIYAHLNTTAQVSPAELISTTLLSASSTAAGVSSPALNLAHSVAVPTLSTTAYRIPHDKCLADPAVQAGAARLQTTFMIIMVCRYSGT
jgi:hypothetical protein